MAKDHYKYFRLEAEDLIARLSEGVLSLEKGADAAAVTRLLRLAHTLKGAARVVRVPFIGDLAHQIEDTLSALRDGAAIDGALIDGMVRRLDAMRGELARLAHAPAPSEASVESSAGKSDASSSGPKAKPFGPGASAAAPEEASESPALAPQAEFATARIDVSELAELLAGLSQTVTEVASVRTALRSLEVSRALSADLARNLNLDGASGRTAEMAPLAERLATTLGRGLETGNAAVDQLEREILQVHEQASRLRLIPVAMVLRVADRATRDAARVVGKQVSFDSSGGDVRLDAHVLVRIQEVVLHLVRNAVAHGVEAPADRIAAGKPAAGGVSLHVERRGNRVLFAVHDDGRGIDVAAVGREAARRGLVSEAEASQLDVAGALALLLRGGLSTAEKVDEISGRGVGLDAVARSLEELGGTLNVQSAPGRGTRMEASVPVTLQAVQALMVGTERVVAAIPLSAVHRVVRHTSRDVLVTPEGLQVDCDGALLSFVPLARALAEAGEAEVAAAWSTVIISDGAGKAAIGVDRLLGRREVLSKPVPSFAHATDVIAGAAISAEGIAELVLDPAGLVRLARAHRVSRAETSEPVRLPVLVVDDSLTTRMMEQSILESAGYAVDLATSAEEALEMAREKRYSLFVVDVEMPGMNGFEFVATTRADPVLREVPAILVTSLASPEDRRRGKEAGASAYIVKGEFDQAALLRSVKSLVG